MKKSYVTLKLANLFAILIFASLGCTERPHVEHKPEYKFWSINKPPVYGELEWRNANYSSKEWTVLYNNGKAYANSYLSKKVQSDIPDFPFPNKSNFNGSKKGIEVDDGWIIGFNRGEWGGDLWWLSKDKKNYSQLNKKNIVQFIRIWDGVFILEGLAHLTMSLGSILHVEKSNNGNNWNAQEFVRLTDAPYIGMCIEKCESLLIVTSSKLLTVNRSREIKILLDDMFWWGMFPDSLVVDGQNTVFIGMRGGIVSWPLYGKPDQVKWLQPKPNTDLMIEIPLE